MVLCAEADLMHRLAMQTGTLSAGFLADSKMSGVPDFGATMSTKTTSEKGCKRSEAQNHDQLLGLVIRIGRSGQGEGNDKGETGS